MRIPLSWLKQLVEITLSVDELAERLTLAGMEVSSIERIGDWWDPETINVGQVSTVLPHPNADRLVLVDVDFGGDAPQRVVTGAPNLFQYRGAAKLPVLKVAFARTGAELVDAYSDERPRPHKRLKPSKIRGVESAGMVCSERELGLSEEHEGILILPEDAPVGVPLRDYLGEVVLDMEVTPDMARCLSVIGVAREVSALTGAALHLSADEAHAEGDDAAADYVNVRIDDPELCNRYTALLIRDVAIGESPRWLQNYLAHAGMRPINNVVDITNFVMLEWGQPLHAFDYDVLKRRAEDVGDVRPTIIVRRASDGEKFVTLDDVERDLDAETLMIADTAGSIAIAGVMGGQESEVSPATRTILLESATFEGINNRRTAGRLRLSSEASYRFARGVPATLNPVAARRAVELMRRYAGGRIVPGMVDAYPVPQAVRLAYTSAGDIQRLLGMPLPLEMIAATLVRLDFNVRVVNEVDPSAGPDAAFALFRSGDEPLLECAAPWHRLDIAYPADLAEEVARVVGYEQVGLTLLEEVLPVQRRNELLETETRLRNLLVDCGLQEIINHTLTSPENERKLGVRTAGGDAEAEYVVITNPSAPERRVMRRTLLVSALENLARNLRFTNRLATFEIGRVYLPEAGSTALPTEERRFSLLLAGPRRPASFWPDANAAEEMDFFDLKGIVDTLLMRLGYRSEDVTFCAQPDQDPFGPRCAEVLLKGQRLGFVGELHPQVRASFGLPTLRISAAELQIAPLVRPAWRLEPVRPISSYPPVVEDLAFEVPESVTARLIEETIRQAGGDLLVDVALFDIYRGEPIAVGSKSMAYNLTYQSPTRSLTDGEVAGLRRQIIQRVEAATGGRLRQ